MQAIDEAPGAGMGVPARLSEHALKVIEPAAAWRIVRGCRVSAALGVLA